MSEPAVPVLYIGGSGRSGSTLLEALVGRLPGVAAVGELRYVWQRGVLDNQLCGCGTAFRDCSFWAAVFDHAFGGMSVVDPGEALADADAVDRVRYVPQLVTGVRTPAVGAALARHGERLVALYRAIARVSGATVVVDSSKDPSHAFVLAALDEVDLTLLHLVRDSRAVAHSWTRRRRRPEIHWEVAYMRQARPAASAREWLLTNALFELLRLSHPGGARRMRYEDLARDPERHVRLTAAMARVPAAAGNAASVHSVSGNPLRFSDRPLEVRPDDEWRGALAANDRRVVTAITAPLLWRYGYLGKTP